MLESLRFQFSTLSQCKSATFCLKGNQKHGDNCWIKKEREKSTCKLTHLAMHIWKSKNVLKHQNYVCGHLQFNRASQPIKDLSWHFGSKQELREREREKWERILKINRSGSCLTERKGVTAEEPKETVDLKLIEKWSFQQYFEWMWVRQEGGCQRGRLQE